MQDNQNRSSMNTPRQLRSQAWFDDKRRPDQTAIYLERYLNAGTTTEELRSGRPIIGIAQTGSDLSPCNRHHTRLASRVRDGIRDAGGIPIEFPVHPIFENARRPTAALDRNLTTLGLIEVLNGYPLDGVVLTTGCDKTTPALLMGAACVNIPAIVLSGGPMLNGWSVEKGAEARVGSGQVIWDNRREHAAGNIDYEQFIERVSESAPSEGHCNTMGTALTMNCIAEALGMSLPGCAAIPAPYRERGQMAYKTGVRCVEMVWEDLKPSDVMTTEAFRNAIALCSAIGGSSNAPPHLQAISHYLEAVDLTINDWHTYGEAIPLLVNCQPAGEYLGEEFYRAGGVPAVMSALLDAGSVVGHCTTVNGRTIEENCSGARSLNPSVISDYKKPLIKNAGFTVLHGNFFSSAIMKQSVIDEHFKRQYLSDPLNPNCFTCRAVVFDGPEDYHNRINDPTLQIDKHSMLIMRYSGPLGFPGSAEVVNMLPPERLVKQGIAYLPTMGDGRQSGTSASPSILNLSPEAAVGGTIAVIQDGDVIEVDLNSNRVTLKVEPDEIEARLAALPRYIASDHTPWEEIYRQRVNQLEEGAVLKTQGDFSQISQRHGVPRHNH